MERLTQQELSKVSIQPAAREELCPSVQEPVRNSALAKSNHTTELDVDPSLVEPSDEAAVPANTVIVPRARAFHFQIPDFLPS